MVTQTPPRTPRKKQPADDLTERLTRQEVEAGEDEAKAAERAVLEKRWPKPDIGYIEELELELEARYDAYRNGIEDTGAVGLVQIRDMRYQRDRMDPKWEARLEGSGRIRTRLSHNEILRVAAMMTRNRPKIVIPAAGDGTDSDDRASLETRWANAVLPQLERDAGKPFLRLVADAMCEGGLGALEVYLTDAHDHIDFEERADESDKAYDERVDPQLREARAPACVRLIDTLSLLPLPGDGPGGTEAVLIVEEKNRRLLQRDLQKTLTYEQLDRAGIPRPGDPGQPSGVNAWRDPSGTGGTAKTITYYDGYWFAYVVDGKFVDGPKPHNQPGLPTLIALGQVTSSSNPSEQMQGITWGMYDMEHGLNDLATFKRDIKFVYGRPAPVVIADKEADLPDNAGTLDFSDPKKVNQLRPGQSMDDAYKHFRMADADDSLMNFLLSMWQRSGLNPIAQGEAPGADPAGYTVNSLTASAQALYEIILENYANLIGRLIDHLRQMIKKRTVEKWYVSAQNADGTGREYIALGPDDVTDTPAEVTIDPMSDVNRLAQRQSLMEGYGKRLVPRRVVQMLGFGAEDVDRWDDEIVQDLAFERLANMSVDEAIAIVAGAQQEPAGPVIYGPDGKPLPPSGSTRQPPVDQDGDGPPDTANGAAPAPVRPPTVGATGARGAGGAPIAPRGGRNSGAASGGQPRGNNAVVAG